MQLTSFQRASLEEKTCFIEQQGHYLALRQQGDYKVMLYHTGNFFAEVWYDYHEEHLLMIEGFASSWQLYPYLNNIQLPVLFQS